MHLPHASNQREKCAPTTKHKVHQGDITQGSKGVQLHLSPYAKAPYAFGGHHQGSSPTTFTTATATTAAGTGVAFSLVGTPSWMTPSQTTRVHWSDRQQQRQEQHQQQTQQQQAPQLPFERARSASTMAAHLGAG